MSKYDIVIGLETHVQLNTESKIFTGAATKFGRGANENIDPVTLGLPGALPVVNKQVIESAIKLGLATNSKINCKNRFARKHYFYPDLPKGYQISQHEAPICEGGSITFLKEGTLHQVGLVRIHMEEDAGKSIHEPANNRSLIDLNRAGVPLLEIVSEPEIYSIEDAGHFLRAIRQLVRYLNISDGNLEEGSLRCDANISLKVAGSEKLGTRAEIKNINSFRYVEQALEYEVKRQSAILDAGEKVVQETRLFDVQTGITRSLRLKEEASDYRYFPDPDLISVRITENDIARLQAEVPKLPLAYYEEFLSLGVTPYVAAILISDIAVVEYFLEVYRLCGNATLSGSWLVSELFGALNKSSLKIEESPISAAKLGALLNYIEEGTISGKMAKTLFEELFQNGGDPKTLIESRGLQQISDVSQLEKIVQETLSQFPTQIAQYRSGQVRVLGFLVGQVLKSTKGSGNPQLVNELVLKFLSKSD
jgi:aspartyl-tRNA(Asn)/glutamyl-tRNA(Gln) amidotransferase subunit B